MTGPPVRRPSSSNEMVCEVCGSGSDQGRMAKCTRCNAHQHCYCFPVVTYEVPDEWCCCECQKKLNRDPSPSHGGQTTMLDNNTRNRVHQAGLKIPKKFENAKVKFISHEEAALLNNKERPPHCRSIFSVQRTNSLVRPASPPNMKQSPSRSDAHAYSQFHCKSSNVKQSPSRSDTQVRFLKQCASASQNKAGIAGINMNRSPPNMKKSPSRSDARAYSQFHHKSPNVERSPSRSDTQMPFVKQCAGASQNQAGIPGINMKQKAQSGATVPMLHPCNRSRGIIGIVDSQIQNDQREKKVLSADKATMNHQSQDGPREKSGSNATDTDIGRGSETSLSKNIDKPVVINSSVQYTRPPPPENCWTGFFFDGSNCNLGDFKAYFPSKVSSKVLNVIKSLPIKLKLEILPRMDDWPKSFETNPPVYEDIGLFFFPTEVNWNEKRQPHLMETSCNFVMRAYINNIKLLIYSSEVLPPDSQWIDGENYLWGVFVNVKRRHKRM